MPGQEDEKHERKEKRDEVNQRRIGRKGEDVNDKNSRKGQGCACVTNALVDVTDSSRLAVPPGKADKGMCWISSWGY